MICILEILYFTQLPLALSPIIVLTKVKFAHDLGLAPSIDAMD